MIADKDRSGWFGASDTHYILGNWSTKTFEKWWLKKEGIDSSHFDSIYTIAGTEFEHRILEKVNIPNLELDKQILIPELRVRVNLDGNDDTTDYEVKTYKYENGFKPSKAYIEQVNVQMYASGLKGEILAYGLKPTDYTNFLSPIEIDRLQVFKIDYDKDLIDEWLRRVKYLKWCLDNVVYPTKDEYERWSK